MNRQILIESTITKIKQLPDKKLKEVNDFAEFLLSKIDDATIKKGILKLATESKSFEYLTHEEDLYSVNDLKEQYK